MWYRHLPFFNSYKGERYLPTSFDDSLTLTQKLNKVIEFLNQLVLEINNTNKYVDGEIIEQYKQIEKIRDEFNELKKWIENEGVSESVINTLNEWFENGKLADLINKDVFDMKADIEWVEKELNETTYYDKYVINKNHDPVSETDYWITEIIVDETTPINFKLTNGGNGGNGQTVREYATENNTTLSINASTMTTNSVGNMFPSSVTIIDGDVITDEPSSFQWHLGITDSNKLIYFEPYKTSQEMFNEVPNLKSVITAFTPIIIDGESASQDILDDGINYDDIHPRQVIGQKSNGNIIFFTTGGRGYGGKGMTLSDCIRILQNIQLDFAFMLDGGGSTSLVEKGVFINERIDALGTKERKRPTTINVGSLGNRPYMSDIRNLYSKISNIEARLHTFESPQLTSDLDDIKTGGFYWALRSANGVPNDDENSWSIIHFQLGRDRFQIAFPYRTAITLEGYAFIRRVFGNDWTDWRNVSETRRINNLSENTPYKDINTGHYHNWVSGWTIDGEERNGFLITEKGYGMSYRGCIQTFYESSGYNVYYRKPNNNETWSRWFKYEGSSIERD